MIKDGPLSPDERIEAGLRRIAAAYKRLFSETRGYRVTICLENTAGGGTTLGRRFEELARLRNLIVDAAGDGGDGRTAFCMDTCHALAAGYDFSATTPGDAKKRSRAEAEAAAGGVLDEFDRVCGLKHLRVMHLNDSLGAFDSRVDRHAHIGTGHVALGAFAAVVNHPALSGVPKILETPKEDGPRGLAMDTINLRKLRSLMSNGPKRDGEAVIVSVRKESAARR